jgi:SAM-dependent methyltransferase
MSTNPAETYEREIVPALFEPWARVLVDVAAPPAGARVLDVACGTGVVAREAARRLGSGGRVTGLDLNPAMLEVAADAARGAGVKVEWRQGRAEAMPLPDAAFDLVLCQQGLQFVPEADRPRAVAEMFRVLRPGDGDGGSGGGGGGGRLALAVWRGLDHHPLFATLNDVILRHLGIPALAAPFSFGDPDALRDLLAGAGFVDVLIEQRAMDARFPGPDRFVAMQVDVIAAAVPATQHLDAAARAALVKQIEGDSADALRRATQGGRVVVTQHANLARARRP